MRENNMTRKIIYSLLFSRPLFEYAVTVDNQKHIDVLIIGDDDTALEAFKAVYWCCQMSDDYYTSITLAGSSSYGLKKKPLFQSSSLNKLSSMITKCFTKSFSTQSFIILPPSF